MAIEPLEYVDPAQLYQLSADLRRLADAMSESKLESKESAVSAEWVRTVQRTRRIREEQFGPGLFGDPAWDMILDLFAAYLEGRHVSVSSLCIASAVPPTTALRWIRSLEERGLIVREADPRDGRRVYLELAPETAAKMRQVLAQTKSMVGLAL